MTKINILEAFQAGKCVANPENWKNHTVTANTIIVLVSGIVGIMNMFDCGICNLQLSPEQLIGISTGVMAIAGIFNTTSTIVTSEKVGFKSSKSDDLNRLIEK